MTVAIFRPDKDPETSTVDGDVSDTNDAIWDTLHDAAGSAAADLGVGEIRLTATAVTDDWSELYRCVFLFDISSLPAGTLIQDFFLFLDVSAITETLAGQSAVLVEVNPDTDTALIAGDYAIANWTVGVPLSDTLALSSATAGEPVVFTLNQAGKDFVQAAADGAGIVRFGVMLESDRADLEPTWASGVQAQMVFNMSETSGDGGPKLILTYAIPAGGTLGGQSGGGLALLNL